ncbi:MAG: Ribonuclease protein component [Segetibacter sp.]|nr:Ribonuclease protein component [Segetibacter sp.]
MYDFVENAGEPLQAGVTASSRHYKKAVQRNRIKRVMRETFRLQKADLQETLVNQQKSLILFFIYIGKELPVFAEVQQKMQVVLQRLTDNVLKQEDKN